MTKISQLSDIGGSLAAGDEFVIRDVSDISTPNKKVKASGFIDYVIAQGVGSGFTQISAGATAPASVRCFSSGTTREVIVTTSGVERLRINTSGQILAVGLGTVTEPVYTFNGDPNTGFYSPGADQAAIATSGTERLRITSTGNVGIGTASPGYPLHVERNQEDLLALVNTGVVTYRFQVKSDASLAIVQNSTERARIDASGRLLVGVIASPAHQLQVSTDSAGKPSTNTWTIVSDERIKEDIELADLDLCYQAVKDIPLKRFKWKDEVYTDEQVRDRHKLGWIAQDVEAVYPKAVGTHEFKYNQVFEEITIPAVEEELDEEGNVLIPAQSERIEQGDLISEDVIEDCRDLNSDQLYAAMYGAMQKLIGKVETLEAEIAILKSA